MKTVKLVNGRVFFNGDVEFENGAEVAVDDSVADFLLNYKVTVINPLNGDEQMLNYFEEVVKETKTKKVTA